MGLAVTFFASFSGAQEISFTPSTLSFGSVSLGSSNTQPVQVTNVTSNKIVIEQVSASGTGYSVSGISCPVFLSPAQSLTFDVTFAPPSAGTYSGLVSLVSQISSGYEGRRTPRSTSELALSGSGVTPGTLSANPASLAFGNVAVGSSTNLSETLTNTGGSSVTISQANVTGTGFSITGLTLPTTLTSNQSVTFTATFAPTASGSSSGTLSVVSNASNSPLSIPLSGTATAQGQLSVSPATLSFGTVTVGASASLNGSLTAAGASVIVSSAGSNSSEFVLSGITLPATIAAGQSAPFTVTFTPNASGASSATLTFTSNASNSPTTEALTGTGQAAPQHYVDLTWNTDSGAVSYNIYRMLASGSSYTQISSGDTTTAYTDNNVTAGQTYDYVVTAVNAEDQESGYSNMVQVIVPSP